MIRNHFYKYDPYTPVDNIINHMTKKELHDILDDYGTKLDIQKFCKHRPLFEYRSLCRRLNAALCIQHYAAARHATHTLVNNNCPITLSMIINPITIVFKGMPRIPGEALGPTAILNQPFHEYVCTYEIEDFSKYLMSSMSFVDLITQRPLSKLHIRKIDTMIHRKNLFLPSLFNLYMLRSTAADTRMYVNPHSEIQALLLGLERSITQEVSLLHDYVFENIPRSPTFKDMSNNTSTHSVMAACAVITRVLNQIKKIDYQHMMCVRSDVYEHLKHAAKTHLAAGDELHNYIFDSLNRVV